MSTDTTTGQRPTLLTVICILSFIAGAFGLWSGFQNAFTDAPQRELEEAKAQIQESMDQMGDAAASNPMVSRMMEDGLAMAKTAAEKAKPIGYTNLALTLLGLLGVWQMWNLKKNGFWLYLIASIGGLIAPLVFLGTSMVAIMSVGLIGLISIVFIILYAVNLKHMS